MRVSKIMKFEISQQTLVFGLVMPFASANNSQIQMFKRLLHHSRYARNFYSRGTLHKSKAAKLLSTGLVVIFDGPVFGIGLRNFDMTRFSGDVVRPPEILL